MDFNLTDEQQMLLESVDEFCERYFTEDVVKKMYEDHGMPQEIAEAYRDAGFGLMGIPEEYGGIPMDPATMVLHYAQETFEGMKAYRTAEGKADGTVYRYTCQVGGKICHLTYEEKDRRSETAIRS